MVAMRHKRPMSVALLVSTSGIHSSTLTALGFNLQLISAVKVKNLEMVTSYKYKGVLGEGWDRDHTP